MQESENEWNNRCKNNTQQMQIQGKISSEKINRWKNHPLSCPEKIPGITSKEKSPLFSLWNLD